MHRIVKMIVAVESVLFVCSLQQTFHLILSDHSQYDILSVQGNIYFKNELEDFT